MFYFSHLLQTHKKTIIKGNLLYWLSWKWGFKKIQVNNKGKKFLYLAAKLK